MSMKKSELYGKRIECIIGMILLIPPLLGVISFTINMFIQDSGAFATLSNLGNNWIAKYQFGVSYNGQNVRIPVAAMSAAPIFLGIMALAGSYLIKNTFQSFFTKGE